MNIPANETRLQRAARQRAAYAAYLATTADEPKMSEGAFASHFGDMERARLAAEKAAAPTPAATAKSIPVSAPKRVDRVWAGGDRDSDDITYSR